MLTVPEAVGWLVVTGLLLVLLALVALVYWGCLRLIRGAIHAEIDRRAHEHHGRTRDEAALHVLEDTPGEGGDDDR